MRWTVAPFGKYEGKTLPEIIVWDLDWFFWILPKLYGKLADEAQELAQKARKIKIPKSDRGKWEVEYQFEMEQGSAVFRSSKPIAHIVPDGRRDCRTLICRGRFAERDMTSEQAAS